jgi:hypothetical protein
MIHVLQSLKVFLLLLFITVNSFACDVCSCGSASNSVFTNAIHGSFIGLSYNHMFFQYKEGVFEDTPMADDRINTVAVTGQYQINDRVLINAILPYRFNYRYTCDTDVSVNGFGDVSIYGLISVLNEASKHVLKVGLGLKLPTGKFDLQSSQDNKTSSTQLGTGSLDVVFPMQYAFGFGGFSFNVSTAYFIKNTNSVAFKYGNQTQVNTSIAYAIPINKGCIMSPYIGVNYDQFKASERFEIIDHRTSGYMTNTNFGVQMETERVIIGFNSHVPLGQNLIQHEVLFKYGLGVFTYWRF